MTNRNNRDYDYDRSRGLQDPYDYGYDRDYDRGRGSQGMYGRDFDRNRDFERGGSYDRGFDRNRGFSGSYGRDYNYDRDFDRSRGSYGGDMSSSYDRYGRGYNNMSSGSERDFDRYGRGYNNMSSGSERDFDRYGRGYNSMSGRGSERDFDRFSQGYGNYGQGSSYSEPSWSYTEIWMIPGPFTGRGPKGYQRSDERIHEDVCNRLTQHGQLDASDIQVNVRQGEVTLQGTVDNRQTKRMAEDAIENISGVKEVHNQLRVKQDQQDQQAKPGTQGMQNMQDQQGMQSQQTQEQRSREVGS